MSTNPTTRIAERRGFIAERTAELQTELNALAAEAVDLDTAERVLKRFSDPLAVGGEENRPRAIASSDAEDEAVPTLPQMVFTIIEEAKAAARKGADSNEIVSVIRTRRKPHFTADNLLHTLQFRSHPSNVEGHASDGGRGYSQALGNV